MNPDVLIQPRLIYRYLVIHNEIILSSQVLIKISICRVGKQKKDALFVNKYVETSQVFITMCQFFCMIERVVFGAHTD